VARISVVVPAYDVEPYIRECLASIAAQTVSDLDVIVVDDGSRDGTRSVAEEFAAGDARFRVVAQENRGLGAARNAGIEASSGPLLGFVDGDDVLPPRAYEHLSAALARTGSDFAAGNVLRLTEAGTEQARFLRRAFATTRLRTHVTRFDELIVDRIVPNKLWRREFWDAHSLRFPEGVVHEDIPVVVPAHFLARSVDVISEPVYLYRTRGDASSITQRRAEKQVMLDRVAAVRQVHDFLVGRGDRDHVRLYDRSVVAEDLRYFVDVLDAADDEYRAAFVEAVDAFFEQVDPIVFSPLPAIERVKWDLVRRGAIAETLEVLRFQREELQASRPVRIGRRWYGDYPYRDDERLGLSLDLYRVPAPQRRWIPEPLKVLARRVLGRRPA
jgi:CDP-glycerol glycerophosphotransferase